MTPGKLCLSTSDVAALLNMDKKSVIRLCDTGQLACHRTGVKGKRFILRESIDAFLLRKHRIEPHVAIEGTTQQLTKDVRLMLLELRRRPDFSMESIRDVIS